MCAANLTIQYNKSLCGTRFNCKKISAENTIFKSLVIVLVLASLVSCLGTSGSLCHDDLINFKNSASSVGSVFQAPPLGHKEIEDLGLLGVNKAAGLNVHTLVWLVLRVGCLQPSEQFRTLHARVFGQRFGQSFQSLGKSLNSVLLKT